MSKKITAVAIMLVIVSICNGQKYLDCYEEEARLFGVADINQHIDVDLAKRLQAPYYVVSGHKSFKTPGFAYDFTDKKNGDFSVTYTPVLCKNPSELKKHKILKRFYNLDL